MIFKTIKQFENEDILEITLLSASEYERCWQIIPKTLDWWWLRTPGLDSNSVASVNNDGSVYDVGYDIDCDYGAVRPAFKIKNLKPEIGEKVLTGGLLCTVIDSCCVLSDYTVSYYRFDDESNDFETSEIKEYINSDKFKKVIGVIG